MGKNKKILKITHSGEVLFWLIISFVFVSIFSLIYSKNIQIDNDYTIFMNDVDGLIVGSPVRMMGIDVGYITKIQPTHNEMYVKFIITDKNINIPQGTIATVEFSGMAGSKSLELYVPTRGKYITKETPIITVTNPKRLHDAASLLNDMLDKIGSIIYTSTSFGKKVQTIELPKTNEESATKFVEYADKVIDDSNKKIKHLKTKSTKESKND